MFEDFEPLSKKFLATPVYGLALNMIETFCNGFFFQYSRMSKKTRSNEFSPYYKDLIRDFIQPKRCHALLQ